MSLLRQARKSIGRVLFSLPDDGAALWTLEPDPDAPRRVDILRIGDCEWREVEQSHTLSGGPGYPLDIAAELERRGVAFGWQNIFAWNYDELPEGRVLRKRRRAFRADPDLVVIGVGMYYAIRHVFGYHRRMIGLRENAGRWVGPLIWPIWRVVAVLLRIFGHSPEYRTPERIEWFVEQIRSEWPNARILIQEPLMQQAFPGQLDPRRLQRARDELLELCNRLEGVDWMPAPPIGTDRKLYGCNGVNLNRRGSVAAGKFYAQWLIDNGYVVESESAAAQSTSAAPQT